MVGPAQLFSNHLADDGLILGILEGRQGHLEHQAGGVREGGCGRVGAVNFRAF